MSHLVLDVETTTKNSGHPFTPSNKLCLVGVGKRTWSIEYDDKPFGKALQEIQEEVNSVGMVVGFNIKFDLHWLRRYGILLPAVGRVHDCQLAYFLLTAQQHRYPSLNEVAEHYGLGQKHNEVADLWKQGVDTRNIPLPLLTEYLEQDLLLTDQIYHLQCEEFKANPKLAHLFSLQCQDLLVLAEMEWNGLPYDREESVRRSADLEVSMLNIRNELTELVGLPIINWDSPEHISAALYGGVISEDVKTPFLFTYKDPKKEPVWKMKWEKREHSLPRLVEPLKNSAMKKDGVFSTSEGTLLELKATGKAKKVVQLLLSYAEISKLNDYYAGIPKLMDEMEWDDGIIHGNLNQCSVVTGRLSSNKPNLQNMSEDVHQLIGSRYG